MQFDVKKKWMIKWPFFLYFRGFPNTYPLIKFYMFKVSKEITHRNIFEIDIIFIDFISDFKRKKEV